MPVQFAGPHAACFQAYGHSERIFDVRFSPCDPNLLASASEDTTVRLWRREPDTGAFNQTLCCYGHSAEVMRLGWSASGKFLASGSADNTVRIWLTHPENSSVYTGKEVALLRGHPEEVYHCEFFDPSGIVRRRPALPEAVLPEGEPAAATPRPFRQVAVGKFSFTGSNDFVAPKDSEELPQDESFLLTASSESMYVWDLSSGQMTQKVDAPGTSGSTVPPGAIGEGYKHSYIFGCSSFPTTAQQLDQHVSAAPAVSGELRTVVTACSDGVVRLWSMGRDARLTMQHAKTLPDCGNLTSCTFNSKGSYVAVTCRDGTVFILDPRRELAVLQHFKVGSSVLSCACLPATDGGKEMLMLAGRDGRLRFHDWNDPTGVEPEQLGSPLYKSPLLAVSASCSGESIAIAGEPQEMAPLSHNVAPPNSGSTAGGATVPLPSGRPGSTAPKSRPMNSQARRKSSVGAVGLLALDKAVASLEVMDSGVEAAAADVMFPPFDPEGGKVLGVATRAPIFMWQAS